MKLLLPEGGMVAIINTVPRYYLVEERTRAFFDFFKNESKYNLRIYHLDSKEEEKGYDDLLDMIILKNKNFKGLYLPGGSVVRCAKYIHKHTLKEKIHIVGYDLTPEITHYLKNDTIDFLISPKIENQAYQGIYALYRHCVLQEPVPKEIMMPIDIIIKENLDE